MQAVHDISHVGFTKESDTQKRTFRTQHETSPKTSSLLSKYSQTSKPTLLTAPACRNVLLPPAESLLLKHTPLLPQRTCPPTVQTQQSPESLSSLEACLVKWRRPTLPRVCSTIGACGLNCSVRDGKRWIPAAITAVVYQLRETKTQDLKRIQAQTYSSFPRKGFGLLVRVG